MTDGIAFKIESDRLETGTALALVGNKNLTSGKLLEISTQSRNASSVVQVRGNQLQYGTLVDVQSNYVKNATLLSVSSDGSNTMGVGGKLVAILATKQRHGTMLDVSSDFLTTGTAIRVTSGNQLTTGHAIDVMSTATSTLGGVVKIATDRLKHGVGVKMSMEDLSSGTGFLITSKTGNLLSNARSYKNQTYNMTSRGEIDISKKLFEALHVDDLISFRNCTEMTNNLEQVQYLVKTLDTNRNSDCGKYCLVLESVDRKQLFFDDNQAKDIVNCEISFNGGRLFAVEAKEQTSGTIMSIKLTSWSLELHLL